MIELNKLERVLTGTYKTLREACIEAGIDFTDTLDTESLEDCANCGIWNRVGLMNPDEDGNPICVICRMYYGN